MQDRFKFRYNYNNKIYDVFAIDFFHSTGQIVSLDRKETLMCKINLDNLIQCTGVKDKNGKFIYEGDILRNTLTNKYASVAWHGTGAGYVWSKSIPNSYLYEFGALMRAFGKYEVVGNIYENPELLEVNSETC